MCGVPYFYAKGEADFLCAGLCHAGLASAVISEDMDMLTHGAPILIRGINDNSFRKDKTVTIYRLDNVLTNLKLTMPQFVDMCILCGCDYTESPRGIGTKTAHRLIKSHSDIETLITSDDGKRYDYSNFYYERSRKEFKQSYQETIPPKETLTWTD